MTAGASKAETTITHQPALAPSPQPRPAPTAQALIGQNVERGGPFWMPIWGPDPKPIDIVTETLELATEMMHADARFHADQARRHVGKPRFSRDTAQGEKRRFYKHNFDLGPAAKPVSTQETLNWGAFSVSRSTIATAAMARGRHNGGLRFTGEIFSEARALSIPQPAAAPFPASPRRPSPPPKLAQRQEWPGTASARSAARRGKPRP